MTATNTNYTDAMTEELLAAYNDDPTTETVKEFADKWEKSVRSVIAKLVREGVYQSKPRTTKTGEPIVRKVDLVSAIQSRMGTEAPSLEKATKQDLMKLAAFIQGC